MATKNPKSPLVVDALKHEGYWQDRVILSDNLHLHYYHNAHFTEILIMNCWSKI